MSIEKLKSRLSELNKRIEGMPPSFSRGEIQSEARLIEEAMNGKESIKSAKKALAEAIPIEKLALEESERAKSTFEKMKALLDTENAALEKAVAEAGIAALTAVKAGDDTDAIQRPNRSGVDMATAGMQAAEVELQEANAKLKKATKQRQDQEQAVLLAEAHATRFAVYLAEIEYVECLAKHHLAHANASLPGQFKPTDVNDDAWRVYMKVISRNNRG